MKRLVTICLLATLSLCGCTSPNSNSNSGSSLIQSASSTVSTSSNSSETPSSSEETSSEPEEDIPESVDLELSSGNYTTGIDIPAGKYDIVAVSGNGNVSSDNMYSGGINAMLGVDDSLGLFEKEYKNIKLPKDTTLHISGVVVRISCDKPESGTSERNQEITETVELGSGNFIAGEDFPAGIYDIIAISGNGNVSSDNMYSGGINAIMGESDSTGFNMYEKEYKNIELSEGTTLTISGVKINLVPSK